ncbi:MAG TPA: hypothetical protein H9981_03035 [Candidatus Mediterraneibacter caccavium]|uniref:Uncharacterized protein n=1 Tax=Candidatus Mediterraneibacter caccavium TaxID=2838661 RepID=A0A9D1VWH8_9FIRM|nr:hypothetical protein B5G27_12740 [Lachnoclostridium sp. An76]HIX47982.1 hypothetical protein [Candidatus Mediterraneibacter caccavium]
MHVKARTLAFGGLLLALTVVFMALGSIIETSTLFLLAAASYFVGIVVREFGLRAGAAFYIAAVLLGFITAPNKFYVLTFAAMGFYIWGIEAVWRWLEKRPQYRNRRMIFWISKYVIFNIVYIPIVIAFREMLFARAVSDTMMIIVVLGGQIALFIYDRAYDYVQAHLWGKLRGRMMG